jgi:hypothetical protein
MVPPLISLEEHFLFSTDSSFKAKFSEQLKHLPAWPASSSSAACGSKT